MRDGTHPGGDARWTALDRLVLAAVLLFALGFRLFALTGDMHFDPVIYAQNAWNLLQGTFTLRSDSWYAHRLTVFAPVVPGFALFGVGTLSSRLWPLALALLQVGLVYGLGRRLEGRATGVLAGIFAALAPLDVVSGVTLQPDIVQACFLTAAACSWILAPEWGRRGSFSLPLLSGACFALALVTRENAAPFAVFYPLSLLWRRDRARALLPALLGGALVLVPLLGLYSVATGDPFHRLRVTATAYGAPAMQEGPGLWLYPALLRHVRHSPTGLFAPLFAFGLLAGLARPGRRRFWLLLWALPILLYLEFGSMSLAHYLPVLKRERFLAPLTAPLSLLSASVLLEGIPWTLARLVPRLSAAGRAGWRNLALAVLLALLAANSFLIVRDLRAEGMRNWHAFREVVDLIRREPALPVLFDHWRTGHRFSYYLGFREGADFYRGADDRARMGRPGAFGRSRLGYLSWYPDSAQVPTALVVLDDDALERVRSAGPGGGAYAPGEIPGYACRPPRAWTLVGAAGTFRVYRTGPNRYPLRAPRPVSGHAPGPGGRRLGGHPARPASPDAARGGRARDRGGWATPARPGPGRANPAPVNEVADLQPGVSAPLRPSWPTVLAPGALLARRVQNQAPVPNGDPRPCLTS